MKYTLNPDATSVNPLVFTFYNDSGHGWVAVWKELLRELGIEDKISQYSYMRGKTAYLEEDCDAALFFNALERMGVHYKIENKHCDKLSPIRSYERYSHELEA